MTANGCNAAEFSKIDMRGGALINPNVHKYTSLRRGHLVTGNIKVIPCPILNLTESGSQMSNLQN